MHDEHVRSPFDATKAELSAWQRVDTELQRTRRWLGPSTDCEHAADPGSVGHCERDVLPPTDFVRRRNAARGFARYPPNSAA